ncbi:MAG: rRNA adenine dimethyltransferase family protein [bacterium]|nr:rRNA adenine dimethyltransferase family protein [bacterium]
MSKQRLGQHFLINKKKLEEIIEVLSPNSGETIIEIGPGRGELTLLLSDNFSICRRPPEGREVIISVPAGHLPKGDKFQIIAIEKDGELVRFLQKKFKLDKNIEIIEGDALKIIPKLAENNKLKNENYKIAGNIPYYITGHLLRIIGELENKPSLVVLTVQKEVAERICALPPQMNLLAASVQFWAEPKIIDYIPKTDFKPRPEVDSAVIKLTPFGTITRDSAEDYYKLIKILFKQPRKTIVNNLEGTGKSKNEIIKILEKLRINPGDRPQDLTIEQIKRLANTRQWLAL